MLFNHGEISPAYGLQKAAGLTAQMCIASRPIGLNWWKVFRTRGPGRDNGIIAAVLDKADNVDVAIARRGQVRMARNRVLKSLGFAAFLLSITLSSAVGSGSSMTTDCQRFYPDDQTVDLNISMELEERLVPMRVHESYLEDRWKRVQGATHGAILFRVRFDDFAPVRRDETAALRVNGKQAYYNFLLTDYVEMAELTAVMLSAASPTLKISAEELPHVQRNPADFGLVELEPLQREHRQKDVYVSYGGGGAIDAVAECNAPGTAKFPGCSVRFRALVGVDVNMDFPIERLREWKRLKTNVEEFLNCARID